MSPEEKVLRRIFDLETAFYDFFGTFKDAYLSRKILRHCVESYFRDIERMKIFHSIQFADQHKRAAFTMLWIVRTKPVQLHSDANMSEALLLINELFAIHAGLAHLKLTPSDISKIYLRNLVYTLHYRPASAELLASVAYLLERACRKESP
jgi:hypothetical protein